MPCAADAPPLPLHHYCCPCAGVQFYCPCVGAGSTICQEQQQASPEQQYLRMLQLLSWQCGQREVFTTPQSNGVAWDGLRVRVRVRSRGARRMQHAGSTRKLSRTPEAPEVHELTMQGPLPVEPGCAMSRGRERCAHLADTKPSKQLATHRQVSQATQWLRPKKGPLLCHAQAELPARTPPIRSAQPLAR